MKSIPYKVLKVIALLRADGHTKEVSLGDLKDKVALVSGTDYRTWAKHKETMKQYNLLSLGKGSVMVFEWKNVDKLDVELSRLTGCPPVFKKNLSAVKKSLGPKGEIW